MFFVVKRIRCTYVVCARNGGLNVCRSHACNAVSFFGRVRRTAHRMAKASCGKKVAHYAAKSSTERMHGPAHHPIRRLPIRCGPPSPVALLGLRCSQDDVIVGISSIPYQGDLNGRCPIFDLFLNEVMKWRMTCSPSGRSGKDLANSALFSLRLTTSPERLPNFGE